MSKGEPTSRSWPYEDGPWSPKPWTEQQCLSAQRRGWEWWERVRAKFGLPGVLFAPREVILPCGCNTRFASEAERRVIRQEDGELVHENCPIGGSLVGYQC